jgi:hypothetical protein
MLGAWLSPWVRNMLGADPTARDKLGVGSVAARAIEASNEPVLVVRPGATRKPKRILIPLGAALITASIFL